MKKSIVHPNGQEFSIDLQGEEFEIVAVNEAEMYQMYFYVNTAKRPSQERIDELLRDIKNDLGKVPGVTFPTPAKRPFPTSLPK
jgi:hypothetical protein